MDTVVYGVSLVVHNLALVSSGKGNSGLECENLVNVEVKAGVGVDMGSELVKLPLKGILTGLSFTVSK